MKKGQPEEKTNDSSRQFRDSMDIALAFYEERDWDSAINVLRKMVLKWPTSFSVYWVLGGTYLEIDYYKAICCLKKAVALDPSKEDPSRALFLAYWKTDQQDKSYAELQRFIDVNGQFSAEYHLMLIDLREEMSDEDYYKLAAKYRGGDGRIRD